MRVDVTPRRADVQPGLPIPLVVTITNTGTVIGGYAIRVLGADPGWVDLDASDVSLFPEESRTVVATLMVPAGIPAGVRRIAVQVRELSAPYGSTVAEVDLHVPDAEAVQLRVDPLTVTAGRRATFSVIVANSGNTTLNRRMAGDDAEGKVRFEFEPDVVRLAPGEHAVLDMRARARRPFAGSPVVRVLGLYLDAAADDPIFPGPDPDQDLARDERNALANATFIQRPVLSRGPISLIGLLAAATVFAIVITIALSRLVGQSAADRDLALQVAAARNVSATSGTSGMAGTVRLLTSGAPVAGVAVNAFTADNTTTPIASTATDAKGAYAFTNLAAGQYKLSFRGAGFVQLWYPGAATDSDATTVTLVESQQQAGLDVRLGGIPASIGGTVTGDDVSAATLYLKTIGTNAAASASTTSSDDGGAIVRTVPIGADGTFALSDVPSPSVYQLVVSKAGYATSSQRIDIGAGETRSGVQIRLLKGDGLISGHINSAVGELGGVTITATAGQSTVSTVSLTSDDVGAFTLRGLPTPGSFTVVASKDGYASQTLTLTLSAGQKLTGVAVTLGKSSGTLSGSVSTMPDGQPAAGVTVTVTDGQLTVQTVTQSAGTPGAWTAGGLPLPGTYTVTFSRSDLAAQTVAVALDANGNITPGSQGATVSGNTITVQLQSSTATVLGTISQPAQAGAAPAALGEATVTLNSGASSYTTTSASVGSRGAYRLERIPPGTYTLTVNSSSGTSPRSRVVILSAGQTVRQNVELAAPAALSGRVVGTSAADNVPRVGWTVTLYLATKYPSVATATVISAAPDGSFSFSDIDAGNYIIEVRPTPGSVPTTSRTITVKASQQVTGVVITADG
jgi:5-hydroxyisourate hydrolase-like protein (transthyretin family)